MSIENDFFMINRQISDSFHCHGTAVQWLTLCMRMSHAITHRAHASVSGTKAGGGLAKSRQGWPQLRDLSTQRL